MGTAFAIIFMMLVAIATFILVVQSLGRLAKHADLADDDEPNSSVGCGVLIVAGIIVIVWFYIDLLFKL